MHRGFPHPPDVSADLGELARTPVLIVCAGVKSLLDVPATVEVLETLGRPGPRLAHGRAAPLLHGPRGPAGPGASGGGRTRPPPWPRPTGRSAVRGAVVLARPPDVSLDDVEPLIARILAEAAERGVRGAAVTPYVLERLHRESGGRTLRANRDLVLGNATLAGEVAAARSALVAGRVGGPRVEGVRPRVLESPTGR